MNQNAEIPKGKGRSKKMIIKILIGSAALLILVLAGMFLYHRIMLKKEASLLENPLGQMVEIDGHNMCVYSEGEGKHTLVFLSGSGTVSPILDFKSLDELLKGDYRIVVIEKFGYGFSDIVDTERSFSTMLRQDREALSKLGIEGPFILCPHSMSGIEAILWAQEYPEEVEAIVGLDMAVPKDYDVMDLESRLQAEKLYGGLREMGLLRLYYSDLVIPGNLSKEEKKIYQALAARIAVNEVIYNEGLSIREACDQINAKPKPDVPMILFVSDGKQTGIKEWVDLRKDYAKDLSNVKIVELQCGHYVHNFEYERINMDMREFIAELDKEE